MLFWSLKLIYNYAVTKIKIILTVEKSITIMTIMIWTVTLLVMTKQVIGHRSQVVWKLQSEDKYDYFVLNIKTLCCGYDNIEQI